MSTATPPSDPLKSFGGVMLAALGLEIVVVLLALLAVANTDDGLSAWEGVLVGVVVVALLVNCATVRRPWAIWLAIGVQVVLVANWPVAFAFGIVGLLFALVWATLLWMRWDVSRRMVRGTLPSQQAQESTED